MSDNELNKHIDVFTLILPNGNNLLGGQIFEIGLFECLHALRSSEN